jgi:hypothetical protein
MFIQKKQIQKQISFLKKLIHKLYRWILKIPAFPYWILAFIAGLLATAYSIIFNDDISFDSKSCCKNHRKQILL